MFGTAKSQKLGGLAHPPSKLGGLWPLCPPSFPTAMYMIVYVPTYKVEDLTETLYQTNKTLAENERKLYEFQDLARSQVASVSLSAHASPMRIQLFVLFLLQLHSDLERNMGIMKLERQQRYNSFVQKELP